MHFFFLPGICAPVASTAKLICSFIISTENQLLQHLFSPQTLSSKRKGKKMYKNLPLTFFWVKASFPLPFCSPLAFRCITAERHCERHTVCFDARAMEPAKMMFSKARWKENYFEAQEDTNVQHFLMAPWLSVRYFQRFLRNYHLLFQFLHFFFHPHHIWKLNPVMDFL